MKEGMAYVFGSKGLLLFLLVFFFFSSGLNAQRSTYLSFYRDGNLNGQWSVDLTELNPGEAMYMVVSDTSELDFWTELNGKSLLGLFDYAMPRFVLQYDSFDCLERTLIAQNDSLQDQARGSGEILGIPGSPLRQATEARGREENFEIRVIGEPEAKALFKGGEPSNYVVEIRLKESAKKEKRILLFRHRETTVPQCFYKQNEKYVSSTVHLFTISDGGSIRAGKRGKSPQSVLLPPKVMEQRQTFQDSLLQHWSEELTPVLVYSWDIGLSGGDKCLPCVAPPPDFTLLQHLGVDHIPEHLNVSYVIFSLSASRELTLFPFEAAQWTFEMFVPARGFLNCDEAEGYRQRVKVRQEEEFQNLLDLMGPGAAFFMD